MFLRKKISSKPFRGWWISLFLKDVKDLCRDISKEQLSELFPANC